jgi:hypothetical protein
MRVGACVGVTVGVVAAANAAVVSSENSFAFKSNPAAFTLKPADDAASNDMAVIVDNNFFIPIPP